MPPPGTAQPQDLALDRADRRQRVRRQPGEPADHAPGGQHHPVRRDQRVPSASTDAGRPGRRATSAADRGAADSAHAGPVGRREQRRGQQPRVDLVVAVGASRPPRTPGASSGSSAPALPAGQRLRRRAPSGCCRACRSRRCGQVVGVQGDREGAAAAGSRSAARSASVELGGEGRVAARRGEVEAEQGLLAVVQFGDRGQHARPRRTTAPPPGSGSATVTVSPRCAARQADGQADDAAADDDDVDVACAWASMLRSLRRHDPDQVRTVGGCQPPSQPGRSGLPRAASYPK